MVDATAFLAPYRQRRVRRPLRLRLTQQTYPLEDSPGDAWISIAFRAFARLATRIRVEDLLIVGSGNGLDALGAIEIFDLRSMAVTDLFEASVAVIRDNVLRHLEDQPEVRIAFYSGDLLSPVPAEARFDLIYENLPNIPATSDVELHLGSNSGRFFTATGDSVPRPFDDYLLTLHYRCLQHALPQVRTGGGVLTAIGGRIPHDIAFDLHRACGYLPELIAFDVKLQSEPELVLPGYLTAEQQNGVTFTFYAAEAIEKVAAARRAGLEGLELASAVATDLRGLSMSTRDAVDRLRRGLPVAHSVLMIFGQRPD